MKKYTQWYELTLQEREDNNFTASVIHYGGYEYLHEAYHFLTEWIEQNGYEMKIKSPLGKRESVKETYLVDSHNARHKEEFQTKLEVDIIKKREGKNK